MSGTERGAEWTEFCRISTCYFCVECPSLSDREWRYGLQSLNIWLIDAGHVCENLYLACEAIGCGTCAVGAYDQELLDELMGFMPGPSAETDYEFAVYVAPAGKKIQKGGE